ncbi:vesicle-associated membrane protein/synaptobrevin-binding protein-like [Mizuhopecten yessoensis]|uniref:Vesicle-associated membrane protein/synaptobrevin-binding protein n=1 Tax=Mizuhopecten yessoensis TaxID=6573 RepID=A0A210PGQ7_MIZYE|nr:vesicle-associated membrane protein/synaptobrevin-binding protein-like [Mizuhopecten yessoensis]OWF35626.1 Vesicle-associated membrane protein/synaptobrevin-binding protein [Mizuhopecten yessoensis]
MARQQVLHLEPSNELRFTGPFNDAVTANLKLSNPEEKKVLFKVKTTAPKRYCVRPNSGIIEPGASITVAVMLQPFEYDPTERNKHKFMVQTLFAPDGPIESQEELWKEVTPDNLMDSKLKCVFEMPVENNQAANQSSVNKDSEEKPIKPVKQVQLESSPPTKATSQDAELRKSLEDKQRLEKEVQSLRDVVSSLKENEARLRKVAMSDTVKSTPAPALVSSSSSQAQALNLPPIVYLIAAFVIGIIISKLIL